ncbi:hypothetical protein ACEE18_12335, partial [Corynebacterium freneyi]
MTEKPGTAGEAGDTDAAAAAAASGSASGAARDAGARDGAITAFWDWWTAEGADRLDAAFTGGGGFGGGRFRGGGAGGHPGPGRARGA